jgi:hypothetical protein
MTKHPQPKSTPNLTFTSFSDTLSTIKTPQIHKCEECGFELWDDEECPYILPDGTHS